jgi:hypothetical protein
MLEGFKFEPYSMYDSDKIVSLVSWYKFLISKPMSLLCHKANNLSEKFPRPKTGINPFSLPLKWFINS